MNNENLQVFTFSVIPLFNQFHKVPQHNVYFRLQTWLNFEYFDKKELLTKYCRLIVRFILTFYFVLNLMNTNYFSKPETWTFTNRPKTIEEDKVSRP